MSDRVDISATIKVNDQASQAIAQMRSALQSLQGVAKSAGQSFLNLGNMKNLGGALRGVGGALRGVASAAMNVVRPIAALAGISGGIGMAEAVAGMENYVKNVRELSRMAPVIGTTVERLSGLQYAAERVGISGESMNNALLRANAAIGKAAVGKGTQLTSLLQRLRINLRDANGQLRSSADILPEFAAAIARQTDPILKQRMAVEMFGRAAGPEMLRLLEQGQGGIEAFVEEARRLGVVIGPEAEKEALDFAAAQREVGKVWQSLSMTLSQNLLPVIKPLIRLFAELLSENKEAIVRELTAAFQALSSWLQAIDWKATIADIKAFGATISGIVRMIGGWRNALIFVGLAMTGLLGPLLTVGFAITKLAVVALPFLVKGIGLVSAALVKLGIALLTTPVGWILLAIAAIAGAAFLIWKYWEPISKFFVDLWQKVRGAFEAVADWLGPWGNLFLPFVIYNNWNEIVSFFSTLWPNVKAAFWTVLDWLGEFVTGFIPQPIKAAWSALGGFLTELWNDPKGAFFAAIDWLGDFVGQFIPEPVKAAWAGITRFFQALWDDVTGIFERAWKAIEPIVKLLRDAIGWITGNMPSLSNIGETVKGWGGGLARWAGFGGAGEAAPSVPAQASVVQQATAAQAVGRIDGEVGVDIHLSGQTEGVTVRRTRESGPVRATGDVGLSMAPA